MMDNRQRIKSIHRYIVGATVVVIALMVVAGDAWKTGHPIASAFFIALTVSQLGGIALSIWLKNKLRKMS
jgi:preprotein translocase subunit SecY